MNEHLMKAILEAGIFVGMSEDRIIDPDAAVSFLEQLGVTLGGLSNNDRDVLKGYVSRCAAEERRRGAHGRADFLDSFLSNLGL